MSDIGGFMNLFVFIISLLVTSYLTNDYYQAIVEMVYKDDEMLDSIKKSIKNINQTP